MDASGIHLSPVYNGIVEPITMQDEHGTVNVYMLPFIKPSHVRRFYEDEDIVVVNKKKGMVVHPANGNPSGTLVNALLYHCKGSLSGINGVFRPGIVHRIDKDTSGLIVVAKNNASHLSLAEQIKVHDVKRVYFAVCYGHLKEQFGTIDAPIGRDKKDRKKMAVIYENSKNAITHYEVLSEYEGFSLVKVRLETGRTHQIRVHFAHIGHPLAGDAVYISGLTPGCKVQLLSVNGQVLASEVAGENGSVTLQLEALPSGIYLVNYYETTIKFIKS